MEDSVTSNGFISLHPLVQSLHFADWADYSVPKVTGNLNKYKVYIIFFLFCKIASKDFFIFYFFIDLLIGLNNLLINFYYYLFLWCSTITPVKIVGAMYEYTSRLYYTFFAKWISRTCRRVAQYKMNKVNWYALVIIHWRFPIFGIIDGGWWSRLW